jgi:hypothetical protein
VVWSLPQVGNFPPSVRIMEAVEASAEWLALLLCQLACTGAVVTSTTLTCPTRPLARLLTQAREWLASTTARWVLVWRGVSFVNCELHLSCWK